MQVRVTPIDQVTQYGMFAEGEGEGGVKERRVVRGEDISEEDFEEGDDDK